MSLEINTELLERAADCIDYWDGTIMAKMLELDIENNDLESLHGHVIEAESGIAREEFYANDALEPAEGEFDVV